MARAQTQGYSQYITAGLRKVWFSTLEDIPKEFRQIFNVLPPKPSNRSGLHYFEDIQLSSLGTFLPKPEGTPVRYDRPEEGNKIRLTPFTFALGFRITEELQEDDLYGPMSRMSEQLAMSAAHQIEVQAHRVLNNGFATTGGGQGNTAAGFDGLSLFNSAHTLLKSSLTRANRMVTDEDLSVTAIEHAFDKLETWVGDSGFPMPRKAAILVVPPTLKWIAKEITESELKPYTGNNEVNPLGGEGLRYMVSHYLTDEDSWFLLSPKAENSLTVWMRREPKFQMGDDFDTGDSKAKGSFRIASGIMTPDGVFGSSGA